MIIGFDAKRAFVNRAGLGNYSRDVIRSLQDLYPDNKYVLFSTDNPYGLVEEKYCNNLIMPPKGSSKFAQARWRSLRLGELIEQQNIDIFHGLSNELPRDIEKTKAIKVVTIHDLIFLKFPQLYKFFDRKIYDYKFRYACEKSDRIIATSSQTKKDIMEFYGISDKKIDVLYQTCNPKFAEKISDEEKDRIRKANNLPDHYLLSVGTIEKRKNTHRILEAVHEHNIDIDIVMVGRKTEYFDEIKAYADSHGLSSRLHVYERLGNADLPAIYQMADIFIYPSMYEGFGIPILEAFFSGTPVITNSNGSTGEIAGNAAFTINAPHKDNLAEAIKYLLVNEEERKKLIQRGYERSKRFDRKLITEELMTFYNKL